MKRIQIDIKSNTNDNFHTIYIYKVDDDDYNTLKDYDDDKYDEVWDRLCDRIERESVPGTLDPDWYIDHIDYN